MSTQVLEKKADPIETVDSLPPADERNSVIAIYHSHESAEAAVKEIGRSGYDMKKLSVVGKDYRTEEHVVGYYNIGERMMNWGKLGAFWGGIFGLLFGTALFVIPGFGPVMAAGPVVAWIVAALENAVIVGGFSAIGAALASIGIPKDSILQYESEIKAGKFALIAHGRHDEVARVREILEGLNPESVHEYHAS